MGLSFSTLLSWAGADPVIENEDEDATDLDEVVTHPETKQVVITKGSNLSGAEYFIALYTYCTKTQGPRPITKKVIVLRFLSVKTINSQRKKQIVDDVDQIHAKNITSLEAQLRSGKLWTAPFSANWGFTEFDDTPELRSRFARLVADLLHQITDSQLHPNPVTVFDLTQIDAMKMQKHKWLWKQPDTPVSINPETRKAVALFGGPAEFWKDMLNGKPVVPAYNTEHKEMTDLVLRRYPPIAQTLLYSN
jgi:hypothetical protein